MTIKIKDKELSSMIEEYDRSTKAAVSIKQYPSKLTLRPVSDKLELGLRRRPLTGKNRNLNIIDSLEITSPVNLPSTRFRASKPGKESNSNTTRASEVFFSQAKTSLMGSLKSPTGRLKE